MAGVQEAVWVAHASQCSLQWWGADGGSVGGGDSLAGLGLVRPPTDGLSSVPKSTCSSSNFIPLMVSQPGSALRTPAPHSGQPGQSQRTPKVSTGVVSSCPASPRMNFEVDGSAQGEKEASPMSIPEGPPCPEPSLCLSFPLSAKVPQVGREGGEGGRESSQSPGGVSPLLQEHD